MVVSGITLALVFSNIELLINFIERTLLFKFLILARSDAEYIDKGLSYVTVMSEFKAVNVKDSSEKSSFFLSQKVSKLIG